MNDTLNEAVTCEEQVVFRVVKTTFYSSHGEHVEWKLHLDGAIKAHLPDLDGFVYGHHPKGYTDRPYGPLESPFWDTPGRVHDWRNYVDRPVKAKWATLNDVSRLLYICQWTKEANTEEWD